MARMNPGMAAIRKAWRQPIVLGDEAAAGRAQKGPDGRCKIEHRHNRGPLFAREIVGHDRGCGGQPYSLADADPDACQQQLRHSGHRAAACGRQRPEKGAECDQADAPPPLRDTGDRKPSTTLSAAKARPLSKPICVSLS